MIGGLWSVPPQLLHRFCGSSGLGLGATSGLLKRAIVSFAFTVASSSATRRFNRFAVFSKVLLSFSNALFSVENFSTEM